MIRLQRTIISLWDCYDKLDGFAQLNNWAVYKILKKRDKIFGVDRRCKDFNHYQSRFRGLKKSSEVQYRLRRLYARANKSDEFGDVEDLGAAVQRLFHSQVGM